MGFPWWSCLQELARGLLRCGGRGDWSCTVVSAVVVLFVGSAFFSFTVVQAHSDKRAAGNKAWDGKVFHGHDGRWRGDFAVRDCAIGWSNHMGCNPNRGGSRQRIDGMNSNRCPFHRPPTIHGWKASRKTGNHLSALTGIHESQTIPPMNAAVITPTHRRAHLIDESDAGGPHVRIIRGRSDSRRSCLEGTR